MSLYRLAALLSMAFGLLLRLGAAGSSHAAPGGPALPTIAARGIIGRADTDGEYVVWLYQNEELDYTIYGATTSDASPFVIASIPGTQYDLVSEPKVDRGIVIWQQMGYSVEPGIRAKNLRTGALFWVNSEGSETQQAPPAISGSRAVWLEQGAAGPKLMLRDLSSMAAPVTLATLSPYVYTAQLTIEGTRIAWEGASEARPAQRQIWQIDINDPQPRYVVDTPGGLSFDIAGQQLILATERPQAINLQTGAVRQLNPRQPLSYGFHLSAEGRYAVWDSYGAQGNRVELYDLQTDSNYIVPTPLRKLAIGNGKLVGARPDRSSGLGELLEVKDLIELIPSAAVFNPGIEGAIYFPETRHTLRSTFRDYWQRHGELPVFGYPNTEEFAQRSADTGDYYKVQYFERQRFEHHPENAGSVYEVLLGRLGDETLRRQGRDWYFFPRANPNTPHYFPDTGHAIAEEFWGYWSSHGLEFDGKAGSSYEESLALFGMPLSEPMIETNSSGHRVLTQWFERARFEYHPNNPDPYKVLLGRLAADLVEDYWP